jgi:hypothetical protein
MTTSRTVDACVCNSTQWHKMIRSDLVWCSRCGSIRTVFKSNWDIPLLQVPTDEVPDTQR